jgi:hypothetical protein
VRLGGGLGAASTAALNLELLEVGARDQELLAVLLGSQVARVHMPPHRGACDLQLGGSLGNRQQFRQLHKQKDTGVSVSTKRIPRLRPSRTTVIIDTVVSHWKGVRGLRAFAFSRESRASVVTRGS